MKFLAVLALLWTANADRLDKTYIPPNAASSGGNAGLQTPFGPNEIRGTSGASAALREAKSFSDDSQAEILKYDNEINEEGWQYAYETSNGIKADQQGRVIPGSAPESGSLYVSGSYSYVGDDGQTYTVTYTADENGYHAEGAHLPTPPPVPEEILRSLELTQQSQGQYDSQKSSYDADAGY